MHPSGFSSCSVFPSLFGDEDDLSKDDGDDLISS